MLDVDLQAGASCKANEQYVFARSKANEHCSTSGDPNPSPDLPSLVKAHRRCKATSLLEPAPRLNDAGRRRGRRLSSWSCKLANEQLCTNAPAAGGRMEAARVVWDRGWYPGVTEAHGSADSDR